MIIRLPYDEVVNIVLLRFDFHQFCMKVKVTWLGNYRFNGKAKAARAALV